MLTLLASAAVVLGLWIGYRWFIERNQPVFPPLNMAQDDPLMLEAVEKARASIPEMRRYFVESPQHVRVKIPFVCNSGETEFLWADLLAVGEEEMEVRYLTPPVTHRGRLERVHRHPIGDLQDWVFSKTEGNYRGGFSMRVMFIRGREAWGELPPGLQAEEAKYTSTGS